MPSSDSVVFSSDSIVFSSDSVVLWSVGVAPVVTTHGVCRVEGWGRGGGGGGGGNKLQP